MNIVVHAVRGTTHALFSTHLFTDGSSGYFSNETMTPTLSWAQRAITATIDSDLSLTISPELGGTVYFRQGSQLVQSSVYSSSVGVFAVRPDSGVSFVSAPAATAGIGFDMGEHVVTGLSKVRVGTVDQYHLQWVESTDESKLMK